MSMDISRLDGQEIRELGMALAAKYLEDDEIEDIIFDDAPETDLSLEGAVRKIMTETGWTEEELLEEVLYWEDL